MEKFMAYVRSILSQKGFMNVFAEGKEEEDKLEDKKPEDEEPKDKKTEDVVPSTKGTVNFEDLIKKAREEEKAKLYPQIEKLKKEKNDLLTNVSELQEEVDALKGENTSLSETKGKLETSLKEGTASNKTVQKLNLKISQLERDLEDARSAHESEVATLKLEAFKEKQIALAGSDVIPELISGNTEEEVLESIEKSKTRYKEIFDRAIGGVQLPTSNPNSQAIQLNMDVSEQEISAMTQEQYAEYRTRLGMK